MTSRKRVKTPGTNSDFRNAFKCFLTAAQLGDTWGQVNLGNFYARGTGVRRSLRRAAYWYKKAYNNGNSCGALNLAIDRRNQGRNLVQKGGRDE
jgi:TPR repeat protein